MILWNVVWLKPKQQLHAVLVYVRGVDIVGLEQWAASHGLLRPAAYLPAWLLNLLPPCPLFNRLVIIKLQDCFCALHIIRCRERGKFTK
jgi:hypothetical protein